MAGPTPWLALELRRKRARETVQARAPEELARERVGRASACARAEQEREQLDVIEALGAALAETLSRARSDPGC